MHVKTKQALKIGIQVFVISFLLNLLWEKTQAPLYLQYKGVIINFWVCFRASIGDAVYTTLLFFFFALLNKELLWWKKKKVSNVAFIIVIGLVTATLIEKYALITERWAYGEVMPLVPLLKVGVTPFLQLALLSLVTFWIVHKIFKEVKKESIK